MTFTALHRALGRPPGPLTDDLLDEAVSVGVTETSDLDWKSKLPQPAALKQSDFAKDVAAMANSGGGIIVYGVTESKKAATGRVDAGDCDEAYERTLRAVAVSAITPPVFDLGIHRFGDEPDRAVVVEIPASVDGPHLIYNNQFFGAPVRNDADTVWMKERQLEVMYRARFEERRHATEALDNLYVDAAGGRPITERAWMIMAAHPRIPQVRTHLSRTEVVEVLRAAVRNTLNLFGNSVHPLGNVDVDNPRPGLRRWIAVTSATGERERWRQAWASVHHDGSVTIATAAGGYPVSSSDYADGWVVDSAVIERSIAAFMTLIRGTAQATANDQYEVRVGIEWAGEEPLTIITADKYGLPYDGVSIPLHRYTPVETTVNADTSDGEYHQQIYDLALDCINQGGISNLRAIHPPGPE